MSSTKPIFDPDRHLCYDGVIPKRILMTDIGYSVKPGTSEVAYTTSFPLLTEEAVKILRADFLNEKIRDLEGPFVHIVPGLCAYQVRGYGGLPGCGEFTKDVWTNSKTLEILSKAVGTDLIPVMDYEIGNVNVQLTYGEKTLEVLQPQPAKPMGIPAKDNVDNMSYPVINWHKDSYAWACIVMLSDPTNMKYGDVVIQKGDGTILEVPPCEKIGYAMLLQGGYITHLARRGMNVTERVTMVPSFRPRDPMACDDSTLCNSYKISNLNRLHYEWTTYRLDLLSERFRIAAEILKGKRQGHEKTEQQAWDSQVLNLGEFKQWAKEQIDYLNFTISQMELP